mmetsp:Transcript_130280/g.324859  ORF Transcript_130280/g.324859 Transcript_130280/m.324859 type:complete len:205 (-) Transcript_130280:143-757(-)
MSIPSGRRPCEEWGSTLAVRIQSSWARGWRSTTRAPGLSASSDPPMANAQIVGRRLWGGLHSLPRSLWTIWVKSSGEGTLGRNQTTGLQDSSECWDSERHCSHAGLPGLHPFKADRAGEREGCSWRVCSIDRQDQHRGNIPQECCWLCWPRSRQLPERLRRSQANQLDGAGFGLCFAKSEARQQRGHRPQSLTALCSDFVEPDH